MRLPSSDAFQLASRAGFGFLIGGLPMIHGLSSSYRESVSRGEGRLASAFGSFASNLLPYLVSFDMPFVPQLLFQAGMGLLLGAPGIVGAVTNYYAEKSTRLRYITTPFSQSFAPTEWTAQFQQRGMEAIMGTRSILGSEATRLAAQYGRR